MPASLSSSKLIEKDVIRHHDLTPVGDHQLRCGNALLNDILHLLEQDRYVERNAVSDDIHHVLVEYT